MAGDRFVPIEAPVSVVNAMTEDRRGNLWIADLDRGLIRVVADRAVQQIPLSALGRTDFITRLAADPEREGLWVGFAEGGVVRYTEGRVSASYGVANGLGKGRVNYLQADRDGTLWVGHERRPEPLEEWPRGNAVRQERAPVRSRRLDDRRRRRLGLAVDELRPGARRPLGPGGMGDGSGPES